MKKRLLTVGLMVMLSSCTWVELTDDGRNVAVLEAAEVSNCARVGDTTVKVADRVVLQRSSDKVAGELETLARNAAARRGGDAIVPASPVRDGQRSYDVYQCRR